MKSSFKTIALIGKYKSPEVAEPLLTLARFLERRKVKVLIDPLTAAQVGRTRYPVRKLEALGREADLAVVIGGDGTMLNIARTLAPFEVPLVGVNQGRLGFLTDISVDNMIATIGTILDGKFVAEKRMLPIQPGDVPATYANVEALVQDVGFAPKTSIETGVERFVAWYRDYYKIGD